MRLGGMVFNLVKINNDNYWQTPAKTELHAFQKIKEIATQKEHQDFEYIAFPWATLIDFLQTGKEVPGTLFEEYCSIKNRTSNSKIVITVCQHIYCYRYLNIFKEVGITDIFWPHAKFSDTNNSEIKIHPFPLYPVIIPSDNSKANAKRDILYSFVGAYDAKYYQTDIRRRILDSTDNSANRVIIERKEWHYNAAVYRSQIGGETTDSQLVKDLESREVEYRDLLSRSTFSLCPSGSGPNSIRLWESIAYGSIPVIFKDNICLPGNFSDWQNAALFFTETQSGVNDCIKMLPSIAKNEKLLHDMQAAGAELYKKYGHGNFIQDIKLMVSSCMDKGKEINLIDIKKDRALIILDPGLKDSGSHHSQINSDIFDCFRDRSEIFVLANEKLKIDANISYKTFPCFSYSVYDFKYSEIAKINKQAIRFSRDIASGLDMVNRTGTVYIHTCTLPLLMGLSFVIDDIFNRIDGIYVELMFLPFGYESVNPNEKDSNLLDYLYVQAIEKISKKLKEHGKFFKISTSNEQFRATYAQMFARKNYHHIEIDIHPHVMLNKNSQYMTDTTEKQLAEGVNTLLHAGDPRPGKGLNWVRNNISKLINVAPKHVNFYCHINEIRFPKDYPQVVSDVSWIEKFAVENPRLIILRDRISRNDWFNFLSKFDYFIIPNEVSHYKNKTSGVVMDAIFSLKSAERVFVFKDTLIYKIMRDENFQVSSIEDVYSILSTFTPRLPGVNIEYINNSKIFRESHASYAGKQLGLA